MKQVGALIVIIVLLFNHHPVYGVWGIGDVTFDPT
jgi:hypothetical protein